MKAIFRLERRHWALSGGMYIDIPVDGNFREMLTDANRIMDRAEAQIGSALRDAEINDLKRELAGTVKRLADLGVDILPEICAKPAQIEHINAD